MTYLHYLVFGHARILIHTSVKLVTRCSGFRSAKLRHFNPHEREARDYASSFISASISNFNPHEREARDAPRSSPSSALIHFNPHEREARDLRAPRPRRDTSRF